MSSSTLEWSCSVCTLLNHIDNNLCSMCGSAQHHSFSQADDTLIVSSQQSILQSSKPILHKQGIKENVVDTCDHDDDYKSEEFNVDMHMDDDDTFDDDDDDIAFDSNDDDDGDGWGDDDDLCYDDQKTIDIEKEEDCEQMLKRALEKRRLAQSKLESFWRCGKCDFLNHPSRAVC